MVELWSISLPLLAGILLFRRQWDDLNRKYRSKEVAFIEERCSHIGNPLKLYGGRHCFLVASTFDGEKVRIDIEESNSDAVASWDYWDELPYDCYRVTNALPGLSLRDIVAAARSVAKQRSYDKKKHSCQHITRDCVNQVSGKKLRELRSEFLQRICHFQPENHRDALVCSKEVYGHLLNQSNSASRSSGFPFGELMTAIATQSKAEPKLVAVLLRKLDWLRSPPSI